MGGALKLPSKGGKYILIIRIITPYNIHVYLNFIWVSKVVIITTITLVFNVNIFSNTVTRNL